MMKRVGVWAAFAVAALATGSAWGETADEAKARIAREHEECVTLHKNDPRAVAECESAADEKMKSHHQNSVVDTKTLYGVHLDEKALAAATTLEKQLGKPLDHMLTVASGKQVDQRSLHDEMSAKIKDAAAALEAKAKPLIDPHAKDLADDLAKWAKLENEKNAKTLASFKERLEKQKKLSAAEIEKRINHEKEMLARRFDADLLRKLDADFKQYDKPLDSEIRQKAEEIFASEKAIWQPKVEAGILAQTKVNAADLGGARDKLYDHAVGYRHYTRGIVYALLRAATFRKLEADIRKMASV